jgi:hypothetical protein
MCNYFKLINQAFIARSFLLSPTLSSLDLCSGKTPDLLGIQSQLPWVWRKQGWWSGKAFPWGLSSISHRSRCVGYKTCCASARHQIHVPEQTCAL